MNNTNIKCGNCKLIEIETIQGSKILNKVNSVKLCEANKKAME